MNLHSSTPFPIPTFERSDQVSPADLLDFLKGLFGKLDEASTLGFHDTSKTSWAHALKSISTAFFKTFPLPQEQPWNTIHEKLRLVETSLELITHAACRVPELFAGSETLSKEVFFWILNLVTALDTWVDIPVLREAEYPSPEELRSKAVNSCVALLRCIGGDPSVGESPPPSWQNLKVILNGCLAICGEILSSPPSGIYPMKATPFLKPHLQQCANSDTDDDSAFLRVHDSSQLPLLLTSVIEVLMRTINPVLLSHWYLIDIVRRGLIVSRETFDYLFTSLCVTTALKRARSAARLVISTTHAIPALGGLEGSIEPMRRLLLLRRLRDGPSPHWDEVDLSLREAFVVPLNLPNPSAIHSVIKAICAAEWGEAGTNIRNLGEAYIRSTLPHLEEATLRMIKDAFTTEGKSKAYPALLEDVDKRLDALDSLYGEVVEQQHPDGERWRDRVRKIVQAVIEPDVLAWMDDDDSLSDSQFTNRALAEVENRFERPLYSPSPEGRLQLVSELAKLPCALVHGVDSQCSKNPPKAGISTIPACLRVISLVLDGTEAEVTIAVRRGVFDALERSVRHHTTGFGRGRLETVATYASKGMTDVNRGVRLCAGRCLAELVRLYQTIGSGVCERTEPLFNIAYNIFNGPNDRNKETTLLSVALMGRLANPDVLGQAVCCLVSQIGHHNIALRGTAYVQLSTLAKHHKKSSYNLLSPYMDRVAPFLVSRLCSHPTHLTELCRFLSVTPIDFISLTLSHTLPPLFGNCDVKTLEAIAGAISTKVQLLFLNHSTAVLAQAFLSSIPGQANKVLTFVVRLLKEAANEGTIDAGSVVRSCVIPLLAELVIAMGDEDGMAAGAAGQAILKVGRVVAQAPGSQYVEPPKTVGDVIKPYMLAIMTQINDLLQDGHGKKTLSYKKQILRSLGPFMTEIGPAISGAAPQIMATLQTSLAAPLLMEVTLEVWYTFLTTLECRDVGPHVGPTSAAFVTFWPLFTNHARETAKLCLDFVIFDKGRELDTYLDEVVDLGSIAQLAGTREHLLSLRKMWTETHTLQRLLHRCTSDSMTVVMQSVGELKSLLCNQEDFVRSLSSGDIFHPLIGEILSVLFAAASRDGEGCESLRILAYDCIGVLGAVDPDRFELGVSDTRVIMLNNFTDEEESTNFALHLIQDVLVGAFRSTSDVYYQSQLAYAIQELLRFCKFTPALVNPGSGSAPSLKVRARWNNLPKHVVETVTPLLGGRYKVQARPQVEVPRPIYPTLTTYREWIQTWASCLISKVSGKRAKAVFDVFLVVVRNKDVGVARHLLPHLVLNALLSGNETEKQNIRLELLAILEDQVDQSSSSTSDKKELSAQTVFMLMDHLNNWVRAVRQEIGTKKAESRRSRANQVGSDAEEQLMRVDSILSSIDQSLMAKAALRCKAYARALMSFEQQVVALRSSRSDGQLHEHYERLHEIYAHLDEPDGMEGVSTLILSPSLEHQIRQHESTGRWTSAQSCWEVQLQQSPNELKSHLGLLRCLRNLGHYDTMRTHVKGVLTRNPGWEPDLVGFQVESGWMVGDWDEVQTLAEATKAQTPPILLARVLLAMRSNDESAISAALSEARRLLGAPITAAGAKGYRRSYDSVLELHLVHELDVIYHDIPGSRRNTNNLDVLLRRLSARLDSTLPTFRIREPILSVRRTAFALRNDNSRRLREVIGQSWLLSSKLARKAGYWQTAYSAMLQAQQRRTPFSHLESAKLIKTSGEPTRALQELDNFLRLTDLDEREGIIDLTAEDDGDEKKRMKAKVQVLRARWMNESDRYEASHVVKTFAEAAELGKGWESAQFHLGRFQDECYKVLSPADQANRGTKMNLQTIRSFAKAIRYGSKYIYQTVPRLLTLWLDMGEDSKVAKGEVFQRANVEVSKAIKVVPVYKWYTAFPQIVSRVGHNNKEVYALLSKLISTVIQEYPKQALWLFTAVVQSTKTTRKSRGRVILDKLKASAGGDVPTLINASEKMTDQLLGLCNLPVKDDKKMLNMSKDFPSLHNLAPSPLIIPLQESLTASLPPSSSAESSHQPFPTDAPTFAYFYDEIEIMRSLARPRKITIQGTNGQLYMFLGKPKDDLRKDARLMDFNSIINKLLKSNSESRRRQLHVRTYGVVTLNEECGFIQWVPNTIPIRPVLLKSYEARNVKPWSGEMSAAFARIKDMTDKEAAKVFVEEILPSFPPVFHEWFLETFPEPSAWLASRLAFSRTAAVMSMVGFILGLGDRHCENILLDTNTGDVVHVDFNCLFDKGKTLETPERVPFRLTQNMVDGLGITGVEGVFRKACEVTMQLLRDNKDSLMSVLDAFVHDPLVEWEDEKRKLEREAERRNAVRSSVDLRKLAKNSLSPIEKKLKGIYNTGRERSEKELSTSSLVQMVIQEAADEANLAKMYPGWAPWH